MATTLASVDEVKKLRKTLKKAKEENKTEETADILETLNKFKITVEVIKETRIGKTVGKLRKHNNEKIASLASDLVKAWKKVVSETNGNNANNTTRGSPPTEYATSTSDKKRKKEEEEDSEKAKRPKDNKSSKTSKRKKDEETDGESDKSKRSKSYSDADQATRAKIVELLVEALGEKKEQDVLSTQDVGQEIEEELFNLYNNAGKDYKTKYRSLAFNLKNPKNPTLRDSLMIGALTAKKTMFNVCPRNGQ